MSALSSKNHTHLFWIPILSGIGVSVFLFILATDQVLWRQWAAWLPYGKLPVFGDLSITLEHLKQAGAGLDPLADPDSEYAYPRAVLALHVLGLQHLSSDWLALFQSVCVVIGVVLVLRPRTALGAILTSLLFFTPPMLLGFERANLDFVLFLVCAVSAIAWARAHSLQSLLAPVAGLLAAAVLKVHPVFAICGAIFAEDGKRRLMWLSGLALLIMYWSLNHADFGMMAEKIPVSMRGSWGCLLFFVGLQRYIGTNHGVYAWLVDAKWPLIGLTTYAVAAVGAYWFGARIARRFTSLGGRPGESAYYWVGAAICCGSFAGSNFAYRWIFVLLTIPLLIRTATASDRVVALWSRSTLAAIAVSLVLPLQAGLPLFLFKQMANWTCILLLIVGCSALRFSGNPLGHLRQLSIPRKNTGALSPREPSERYVDVSLNSSARS